MYEWTNRGLIEFRDYFRTQWLTTPFDAWQLWRRPPGFATISINESFNKMRLELATIVLDPSYIKPPQPRRLAVRNIKRGRPKIIRVKLCKENDKLFF